MNQAPPRRGDQEFAGEVNSMFDRISGVYDRMNRVMTAGLDQSWRARAAERARLEPGMKALDLCCGTGDLAFELAGPGEHAARLADQVQPDVGQGHVLFQDRRMAGPLGDALAEDERGVAHAQQVLHLGLEVDGDGALHRRAHMWSTASGSL